MTKKLDLTKVSTDAPKSLDKDKCKKELVKLQIKLMWLQKKLIASKEKWVLIILQWLDAAGKDGVIRNVIWAFSPVDCDVVWRKAPSKEEASHDFLWRIHKQMPALGSIKVFDRSYYEDILVPSVLWYLDKDTIKDRYETINLYEKYLEMNNIKVIKIYLHVGPEAEKERLEERMTNPEKFWKHQDADRDTYKLRDQYLKVYEKVLAQCNKPKWHIVPADENWIKSYMTAKILVDELESLWLEYPELETERWVDEYLDYVGSDTIDEVISKSEDEKKKDIKKLLKKLGHKK